MSIDANATRVLLGLANFEKSPGDRDRGQHALEGKTLEQATGLRGSDLEDAVDVLEEAGLIKRHRFVGDSIGMVRLTAKGRSEAAKLSPTKRTAPAPPSGAAEAFALETSWPSASAEQRLPRLDVTYGEKLGSGAFGTVWRATDVLLQRDVAVKFLTSTDQVLDEEALLREARSLAKVTHANLVRVYSAAWLRHPVTGLVAPAITMELLEGEPLQNWWSQQRGRVESLSVIVGILAGVHAMHDAGLHHGDLHPQNVMVLADGSAKLIDWRYQDTFLQQSTAHRRDLIEFEQRRAIDLVVSVLEKQGLSKESLQVRGASDTRKVAEIIAEMLRSGSTQASPEIGLSASEIERERILSLRKLEAEARIVGRLRSNARNLGANDPEIVLEIENLGRSGFSFDACTWRVEWNDNFREQVAKYNVSVPDRYEPPHGTIQLNSDPMLPPGKKLEFKFRWSRLQALEHFRLTGFGVPGFNGTWADYHFEVVCRGELGGQEVIRWTERPL